MCFFVCVKRWEGEGGGLFGTPALFGSHSAEEAPVIIINVHPVPRLISHFTRSHTFVTLTVSEPSSKLPFSRAESVLTGRLRHECGCIQ